MFDYEIFDDVFSKEALDSYEHKTIERIRKNRAALGGELFIEKLLKGLGITTGTLQPCLLHPTHI